MGAVNGNNYSNYAGDPTSPTLNNSGPKNETENKTNSAAQKMGFGQRSAGILKNTLKPFSKMKETLKTPAKKTGGVFKKTFSNLKDKSTDKLGDLKYKSGRIKDGLKDKARNLKSKAKVLKDDAKEKVGDLKENAGRQKYKLKGKSESLKDGLSSLKNKLKDKARNLKSKAKALKDDAKEKVGDLKDKANSLKGYQKSKTGDLNSDNSTDETLPNLGLDNEGVNRFLEERDLMSDMDDDDLDQFEKMMDDIFGSDDDWDEAEEQEYLNKFSDFIENNKFSTKIKNKFNMIGLNKIFKKGNK